MKNPNKQVVYLSFPTKPEVSLLLKKIAHSAGMTQPELINTICIDFISSTISVLEERGLMTKTEVEELLNIINDKE